MRYRKWIGLFAVILLVTSCFLPWVYIASRGIEVTGVDSGDTHFGKPGYINLVMSLFFTVFHLIPRLWAKRANLLIVSLNIAWVIRNFFLLTTCVAGECPVHRYGLYVMMGSSFLMLLSALFPDMKLKEDKGSDT